jgi:hypothetical protein
MIDSLDEVVNNDGNEVVERIEQLWRTLSEESTDHHSKLQ